ncbi:MAG: MATE family efflux transporter [Microscillaceae bacterium]|nr:MATE family efflux transporter [Microscillaceae bacterium]
MKNLIAFWQTHQRTIQQDLVSMLQLSYPIVIGQIGIVLMGVSDNVMVGALGPANLAAGGIANAIFFLIAILGIGVMSLVAPLTSAAKAQNNPAECSLLLANALRIALVMGLILFGIVVFLGIHFHWFRQKPEVEALAVSYMIIVGASVIPLLLFLALKNFADGLAITKPAMYITFIGLGLNILFNWLLIHGKWGLPRLGLDGAGYATTFTRIFMLLAMLWFMAKSKRVRRFLPEFSIFNFHKELTIKILRLGLPAGFQYFFEIVAFSGAAMMTGWLGTNQLAAHQIAINLASITYMIAGGFAAAGSIRVGDAKGEGSRSKTLRYGSSAIGLTVVFMTLSCLIFVFFNQFLVSLYIREGEVVGIAMNLLIIAGFFQLSDGVQVVALGALRGLEDVNVPTAITLFAYWVVGLPIAYGLGFYMSWDVMGIWIGLLVGLTVSAILLTIRFYVLANRAEYYQKLQKQQTTFYH